MVVATYRAGAQRPAGTSTLDFEPATVPERCSSSRLRSLGVRAQRLRDLATAQEGPGSPAQHTIAHELPSGDEVCEHARGPKE